jgi:hypothetical protein
MSRVASANGPEGGSASDRAAFDEVRKRLGQAFFTEKAAKYSPQDFFGPLLHAPRVALAILDFGGALRNLGVPGSPTDAALPEDFVEFAALTTFTWLGEEARTRGSAFAYRRPFLNHLPRALGAGLRPEAVDALRRGKDAELLPRERELAGFVRAVLAGSVDDAGWARMAERLGPRRAIETAAYALLAFLACRLESALGLDDATDDEIDALLNASPRGDASRDLAL